MLVLAIALLFRRTPMPDIREEEGSQQEAAQGLWQHRHFTGGVIAQFFYVAAQVGVGAFFINYATEHWHGVTNQHASYLLSIAMISFMVGRFFSTADGAGAGGDAADGVFVGQYRALRSGDDEYRRRVGGGADCGLLFMSIMFPTIFALGVKNMGSHTKRASSFMIMAIVGGAIMPYFMGALADRYSTALAYGLPLLCFPGGAVVRHEPTTRVSGKLAKKAEETSAFFFLSRRW